MNHIDVIDVYLNGILQQSQKMTHNGRIYTTDCLKNAIREYKIKTMKINRIEKLEKINKIYE